MFDCVIEGQTGVTAIRTDMVLTDATTAVAVLFWRVMNPKGTPTL